MAMFDRNLSRRPLFGALTCKIRSAGGILKVATLLIDIKDPTLQVMKTTAVFLFAATCQVVTTAQVLDETRFDQVVAKLEQLAFEFRDQVEELNANRCTTSLQGCAEANFDECQTEFPNPICPAGLDYHIASCGEASSCSGVYDFSTSNIRVAPTVKKSISRDIIDHEAVETICFTRPLNEWFQSVSLRDQDFWENYGFGVRSMYFGSQSGAFRIYPARQSRFCNQYDASKRPWYVAGSSGRKNIVLVLDSSGSMKGRRLDLLKTAATRVIDTLTVGDKVAIVPFSTDARLIAEDQMYLYDATDDNKVILRDEIRNIGARGATNFQDAFTKAFDVLDSTIGQELNVQCNTAILFLTDGEMNEPEGIQEADIIRLVDERLTATSSNSGKPIFLFIYSVGDGTVHSFPSQLACSYKYGIWSRINDEDRIVDSLSSYYKLFALGLGADSNSDFAAWVEPYQFVTGDIIGTTVSVPVYDRSKTPHLFLGVVGVDIALNVLNEALGTTEAAKSIERLALRSYARCPTVNLTECELESYRTATAGPEASCSSTCTDADFVQTLAQSCSGISDYPSNLIDNTNLAGKSFEERVCCAVGEQVNNERSNSCPENSSSNTGAIIGIAVGVAIAVLISVAAFIRIRKKKSLESLGTGTSIDLTLVELMPPPTAPFHPDDVQEQVLKK